MSQAPLDSKQSLDLIKELVEICLNCITYIRDIFPDFCYIDSTFQGKQPDPMRGVSYTSGGVSSVNTKRLVRGKSHGSDMFMDWIDALFDAIDNKVVKCIQLLISAQATAVPHEVYSFEIDYNNSDVFVGTQLNLHSHEEASPVGCQLRVRNIIRNLLLTTQNYRPPPFRTLVAIKVLLDDENPTYRLPGCFHESTSSEIKVSQSIADRNVVGDFGKLGTSSHKIMLKGISKFSEGNEDIIAPDCYNDEDLTIDPFEFLRAGGGGGLNMESFMVPVTKIDFGGQDDCRNI